MDLEARSQQNPAQKNPMLNKLRDYKVELARLKRESQLASRAANEANNRSQLLAGAELDDVGAPTSSSQVSFFYKLILVRTRNLTDDVVFCV